MRYTNIKFLLLLAIGIAASAQEYSFDHSQAFLTQYCEKCHGARPVGGFKLERVSKPESLSAEAGKWSSLTARIRNGEMPPKGSPAPPLDAREQFTKWVDTSLRREACAAGIVPGPSPIRRLNRDEFSFTVRDLLDMHLDIAKALPADGAGGEGFDNAAETLFLSPIHAEKYMEVAKFAMDFAAKEYKSREKIFVAKPGTGTTAVQAAEKIFKSFLPRAFRRPIADSEVTPYMGLFQAAQKQGEDFESSVLFALRAALVSPNFLFRMEPRNNTPTTRPLDQFALASRLSYFIWGSMPDELLTDVAASGKLQNPEVLQQLVRRMLRNDRSMDFSARFTEQWLRTRELTTDKTPDAKLFPTYAASEDLRGDIRFQPIMFFREVFLRNLSLLELIDSKYTIGSSSLAKHWGVKLPLKANNTSQPQWVELPEGSHYGGLLGMPAVLAVSSFPYRTSPVLRGAWVLDSILGTPPPPPPPNVPALEAEHAGAAPQTVRERLSQHRANPTCAGCHSRIDPIGFALENYDVLGRWREQDNGKPVDNSGELNDGKKFKGPEELKNVLLERKELFIRNITSKMLGYALGRGLTLKDSCTIDSIVAQLREKDYKAQALLEAIVLSVPFRYQEGKK